ncbi:hypothetical protein HUO12_09280 [Altererythrobacter sp. JGD-16]|uniref:Uncharacterized protein n=2 Tax=Altererythrobacter lutimaris TaxID=2743979 RepID=A0A850HE47_9SPHN|nr:hypothetical protein [Altererythrobacter lutimaris]
MGATMASVVLLVGTEEDGGALVAATDEISRNTSGDQIPARDVGRLPQPAARPARQPSEPVFGDNTFFTDEEELIDDTTGFDPTPDDPQPFDTQPSDAQVFEQQTFDSQPPSGDVTVVESYGQTEIR